MLESLRRLKLNTRRCSTPLAPLPSLRLPDRSWAFRPQHARCNTPAPSIAVAMPASRLQARRARVAPRSLPPFAYPFCFFPPSPSSLRHPPHRPHFLSHFSLPAPPLVTNPLRNCVDSPMPAGVVCPRALPVQTRARPWSADPDLPARYPARAVGSARGLAIHPAHTASPILPSSSTDFPSHLN
ncbi:hypothetical protein B0H14DRAFT_3013654, partial [Mycena olivaceomarginata]